MKKFDIKNLILDNKDVENKIKRIGFEIIEDNIDERELYVFGISKNGDLISKILTDHISKISKIKTVTIRVNVSSNKVVDFSKKFNVLNKPVVIVGDVSQSGKTFQVVISNLMSSKPSKIKTAVIVNRDQTMYPVKIDYSGLSLSTSVNEHVDLVIDKNGKCLVYLS
tara:strand:- start:603 stop:1103 length:501 start_codon:yes stop_codon:yes gene_type:complete